MAPTGNKKSKVPVGSGKIKKTTKNKPQNTLGPQNPKKVTKKAVITAANQTVRDSKAKKKPADIPDEEEGRFGGGQGSRKYRLKRDSAPTTHWCKEYLTADLEGMDSNKRKRFTWNKHHGLWMKRYQIENNWWGGKAHPMNMTAMEHARRCLKEVGGCDQSTVNCDLLAEMMIDKFRNTAASLEKEGRLFKVAKYQDVKIFIPSKLFRNKQLGIYLGKFNKSETDILIQIIRYYQVEGRKSPDPRF
ncbi:hypothetical protein BJ508DRAFT_337083, partial [Ascobolus immersus RN42]